MAYRIEQDRDGRWCVWNERVGFIKDFETEEAAKAYVASLSRGNDTKDPADAAVALVEAVRPLFAGKPAQVQGAALADLLAIWLAGHVTPDPETTRQVQEEVLEMHLRAVRQLIPINFAEKIAPRLRVSEPGRPPRPRRGG